MNALQTLLLHILPHHLLSRWMHGLTRLRIRWLKDRMIRLFIRRFEVDMGDARDPRPEAYPSFNAFFTRALRPEVRPLAGDEHTVVSPVDGTISQLGRIEDDRLFQAKGRDYRLQALLGGAEDWADCFRQGSFATLYLSPRDYHRIHMPLTATLSQMLYVPGRLYSVNPYSVDHVDRLFARNERVVCLFETAAGPLAMILVGAIFVSGIETVWHGPVRPTRQHPQHYWDYGAAETPVTLARGAEMGRFNMGSTVIVLFARDRVDLERSLRAGADIRMGAAMAARRRAAAS